METKGRGIVYTFTIIHQDLNRGFGKEVPYVLALIELDEGFRIYSILTNDPEEVSIGARASVIFEDVTPEISLYKFKVDS
ncbi:MAG TPA: OB-fold domain-containing protein [Nitrososphaerales archaeon]|nr:OB-fold domain-containing protein [Nitrososphaerales archaeon]